MKKALLALSAGAAIAMAAPASSQSWGANGYADSQAIFDRIEQLEERLYTGLESGAITWREARSLRRDLRDLIRLERRYGSDGLSQDERRQLMQQIRLVRNDLREADGGRSRFAEWRDLDEAAANYQQVSQVCLQQAVGIDSVIRRIFGADNCLRVGERASVNLAGVPSPYRSQFRDGNGRVYRYVQGNVIELDARSGVVTRIYDVA
jgi:hypothetical protein